MPQNAKPDETFTIVVKMQPTLLLTEGQPVENVITADDLRVHIPAGRGLHRSGLAGERCGAARGNRL